MKRYILQLGLMMLALGAQAQSAYKGQIYVSDETFSLQGSMLRVKMRVSYNANVVNRGETLVLKPVLKNGFDQYDLSSVVVTDKHHVTSDKQRANLPVVSRSVRRGTYFFDYDTTVPYSAWMQGSAFYMESEERMRNGRSHVYEDLIIPSVDVAQVISRAEAADDYGIATAGSEPEPAAASAKRGISDEITTGKAPVGWVQFVDPAASLRKEQVITGVIPLSDSRRIGSLNTRSFNEAVENELLNRLSGSLGMPGVTMTSLRITGYGAPTGNHRRNETRCALRAVELKEHLSSQPSLGNAVSVSWVAEDWDSIATLVAHSNMRLSRAASDIISNVSVSEGREYQLRQLDGGNVYDMLRINVFPRVCRIHYTATLRHEGPADGSTVPLQLQELYATAQGHLPSSPEFRDIMDLSARLFPQNVPARINAAGVALLRGDTAQAAHYLEGCHNDPRAYCNLGVMYLLQGDRARADVYLRMALAAGSPQAANVMKSMNE